jgi:hypothetical protein
MRRMNVSKLLVTLGVGLAVSLGLKPNQAAALETSPATNAASGAFTQVVARARRGSHAVAFPVPTLPRSNAYPKPGAFAGPSSATSESHEGRRGVHLRTVADRLSIMDEAPVPNAAVYRSRKITLNAHTSPFPFSPLELYRLPGSAPLRQVHERRIIVTQRRAAL